MIFRVLGPLEVEDSDGIVLPITAHRQRSVLALLLIAAGQTVSSDHLIEAIWGNDLPANPANTLQNSIAQLRKTFEPNRNRNDPPTVILSTATGYQLDVTDHEVDVHVFERGVDRARELLDAGHVRQALDVVSEALALWRGPAYVDFETDDFAATERSRLEERRVEAKEVAIDGRLVVVGPEAVIADLESMVVEHPHREGLWGRLMTALYQAGRQAEALRTFKRADSMLGEELGIEASPALRTLEEQILLQDPDLAPAPRTEVANNLPVTSTSLVGRSKELDAIREAVAAERLVTLYGPGGSGKTRLAIETAWRLVSDPVPRTFDDGVWMVRLEDLSDPALMEPSIGVALRMPESAESAVRDTLIDHLRDRRVLLILDNCEHLLSHVSSLVADLMAGCKYVTVLATSQAPLGLAAEQRIQVHPLGLPGDAGGPFSDLEAAPAVELFLERARLIDRDRKFTGGELHSVVNIVRALDGMPLAIELAAARTASLSPTEIARLMADRFELLKTGPGDAPTRQQSLRSTVEWSYELLDEDERTAFAQLAAFAGGFDREAVSELTGRSLVEALDLIERLLGHSFVVREPNLGESGRFRTLETLRQYGLDVLAADEELRAATMRRHCELFAARAYGLDQQLMGPDQMSALAAVMADEDNFRAAMGWSLEHGSDDSALLEPGVRIAARLGRFWDWRGSLAEANTWLSRFADAAGEAPRLADLPYLMSWRAFFTAELGDQRRADELNERAIAVAMERDDRLAEAAAKSGRAMAARREGDVSKALEVTAEMRAAAIDLNAPWFVALADNNDALAHLARGDVPEAKAAAERSRAGFATAGDIRASAWALTALAQATLAEGDHAAAHTQALEAVLVSSEVGDGRNAAWASEIAAAAARAMGDGGTADRLEEEAAQLLFVRGMPLSPWQRSEPAQLRL